MFHNALALTLAFALVASAAAWRQCTALQLAAASAANAEHATHQIRHHVGVADHGQHDHHAMHHQPAPDDAGTPATDDHGCMKCCTMCTVASAMTPTANASVSFSASAPVFFQKHESWSGRVLAIDPGIPKRIG